MRQEGFGKIEWKQSGSGLAHLNACEYLHVGIWVESLEIYARDLSTAIIVM